MSAISIKNATALIDSKISTASSVELSSYAHFYKSLENSRKRYSVIDIEDLPNAADNKGKLYYVQSIKEFKYSNGTEWLSNYEIVKRSLWTWGANNNGELGDGTNNVRYSPGTPVASDRNWSQVSAGGYRTAAIKTDGTLWTWGYNIAGQLGDGTITSRRSPGTTAGGGTNWNQVSSGGYQTAAIKADGTLWTWGNNNSGQLGDGTSVNRSSPGTTAGGGTNWSQASAADGFSSAIKVDGTLWTWGTNGYGQLGDGTTNTRYSPGTTAGGGTNWSQISAGGYHTAAIKTDGTLWTWGRNNVGQLGNATTTDRSSPSTTASGGTNWSQVSVTNFLTAAIKTDGTLWSWGYNGYGQLGDGTSVNRSSPGTTAGGGTNWSQISAGGYHTAAIKTDGTLWTWGRNSNGQLGTNNTTSRSSPGTTASGGTNYVQVSSGFRHSTSLSL